MGLNDPTQQTDHAHLIQTLSAMMLQLNALQTLVRSDTVDNDVSSMLHIPDIHCRNCPASHWARRSHK